MDTHLLSVNVEKAKNKMARLKRLVNELQSFITTAESYTPISFEQKVIKYYAFEGSIAKVLEKVNTETVEGGQGQRYKLNDISEIIDSKPMDDLHKQVRKIYRTNKKNLKEKNPRY
jgi:hypothetical protein